MEARTLIRPGRFSAHPTASSIVSHLSKTVDPTYLTLMSKRQPPHPGPKAKRPRGPAPEHLKLEGNWEDAVKTALTKPQRTPPQPARRSGQR
jgi:hypothetical protein